METVSALLALCARNSPVNSPHKRPVTGIFEVFVDLRAWINAWVHNPEAGDLRRHRPHYDVIVMTSEGHFDDFHSRRTLGWLYRELVLQSMNDDVIKLMAKQSRWYFAGGILRYIFFKAYFVFLPQDIYKVTDGVSFSQGNTSVDNQPILLIETDLNF